MHHTLPDFPISTPVMIIWGVSLLLVLAAFVQSLIHINKKGHKNIIGCIFLLLLLAGIVIHVVMLARSSHTVTTGNWIQLTLVSLAAALEMFIGHTVVFDDIIAAVVFREPALLMAYVSIYLLIIAYTLSIVLLIMPRGLRDRTWLALNKREASKKQKNHIFLGVNSNAKHLAKNILQGNGAKGTGEIIFVEFPDAHSHKAELSIGELFSNIFGREKENSLEDELGSDAFVLLKGKMPRDKAVTLGKALGLEGLEPWLLNPRSNIYILSNNEEDNFALLQAIHQDKKIAAKVFFYEHNSDSYETLVSDTMDNQRIRLLNPHYMSFMQLKLEHPELMPVHFVEKATDAKGQPLGYVKEGLQAMIVGFADCGQEALRFLYEYGSFVGKDFEPAPMRIRIVDPDIERRKGHFLTLAPAMRQASCLEWSADAAGTDSFWQDFEQRLDHLRYIVIGMDHGHKNVQLGVTMLQKAARRHKDLSRFVILMRGWEMDDETLHMLDYYNKAYCPEGVQVLRPFGLLNTVWKPNIISGKSLKEASIQYLNAFKEAGLATESWEERRARLTTPGGNQLAKRKELHRRQAMDFGRALYAGTMQQFASSGLVEAAKDIPAVYDGKHFPKQGAQYTHFEYLAAGEHLHWMAAMEVSGFTNDTENDELLQTHSNMLPYTAIEKGADAHISWLSVKIALLNKI